MPIKPSQYFSSPGLILLAFALPFSLKYASWAMLIALIELIVLLGLKKINAKRWVLHLKILLPFMAVFLLYLVGLSYTQNMAQGSFSIQQKALFFFIPIFVSALLPLTKVLYLLKSFVLGLSVSLAFCLFFSFQKYLQTGNSASFFYGEFSYFMHVGYYAIILAFALFVVLLNPKLVANTYLRHFLLIVFSLAVYVCATRAALVVLVLFWVFGLMRSLLKRSALRMVFSFLLFISSVFAISFWSSIVADRTQAVTQVDNNESSSGVRLAIWKIAINKFRAAPFFGYGTGDVNDVLLRAYQEQNLSKAEKLKLNTHNQFLETTMALGLFGLLPLLALLVWLLHRFVYSNNLTGLFCLIASAWFMCTEAMLERQTGLVFFILFNAVFVLQSYTAKKLKKGRRNVMWENALS